MTLCMCVQEECSLRTPCPLLWKHSGWLYQVRYSPCTSDIVRMCPITKVILHSKSLVFYTKFCRVPSHVFLCSKEVLNLKHFLISIILLLGTASGPAVTRSNKLTDQKRRDCEAVVEQVFALLEVKTHTRQIMTKKVSRRDHLLWYSNWLIDLIACGKGVLTIPLWLLLCTDPCKIVRFEWLITHGWLSSIWLYLLEYYLYSSKYSWILLNQPCVINHSNHTISLLLQAFENAITVVYALGGSTNGVLHLLALAHE